LLESFCRLTIPWSSGLSPPWWSRRCLPRLLPQCSFFTHR
jgi:hypothetical protein